jgi:hypothetical protein
MQLPLIGDGRLAWSLLRQHPEWAVVERDVPGPGRVGVRGRLLLLDNQWTCVWQDTGDVALPSLRIIGARFAIGDRIAIRPAGGTMRIYRVKDHHPACSKQDAGGSASH